MDSLSAIQTLYTTLNESNAVNNNNQQQNVDFSSLLKSHKTLDEIYDEASATYGVPKNLLLAMTKQESSFRTNATSRSGAQGLMQLMPATAASLGVTDSYDPYQNIMGGTKYIRKMLDMYNGDVSLALAAYNAGANNVNKYGGIPPFQETQNYVAKITKYMEEGVTIPDNETVYATKPATISEDSDITYQELNEFAGEILTDLYAYDDYMKVLNKLVGNEPNMELTMDVVDKEEKEINEIPDSFEAFQNLKGHSASTFLINNTSEIA